MAGKEYLDKEKVVYFKGAPEIIIERCSARLGNDGILPIDKDALCRLYRGYAEGGSRVVAIAYRDVGDEGFIFASLVILRDRLRRGVAAAVKRVQGAGVQVVMLTGDGKETATNIALECGIMKDGRGELVLTSEELCKMSDEQIKQSLPKIRVIARALPQDKTRLVRISQEMDLVVGMTGDGINDAPALTRADVGMAIGGGTDIAIEAADVVITDDSPSKILTAIAIAKKTNNIVIQNIVFAISVKLGVLVLSALGLVPMAAAVFADVGVAVIAILNSMRALFHKRIKRI